MRSQCNAQDTGGSSSRRQRLPVATSLLSLLLATLCSSTNAQVVGEDIFICSPSMFTMTLNLTAMCPGTVEEGPGIVGVDCFNLPNATNTMPAVTVTAIQVLELGLSLDTIFVTNYPGAFVDGDFIEYSSVSAAGNITSPDEIPGGLQLNIQGRTENNLPVVNSFLIEYTNDGSVSPIFKIGDQVGWIVFVSTYSRTVYSTL